MSGSLALQRVERALENHGSRRKGKNWPCPAHDDRNPSLSVSETDDRVLIHCHAGCQPNEILSALDLKAADLFNEPKRKRDARRRTVAEYDYVDESGELLFQVVRSEPKSFRQRRPDGSGGWTWNVSDTRRALYHLPEVIAALQAGDPVLIVEGEKDTDAVRALGLTATCSPMGAGKWREEYAEMFAPFLNADVRIVADRDEIGYRHAADIENSLRGAGLAPRCFEASEGKDVSDHLAAGLSIDDLIETTITEKVRECVTENQRWCRISTPADSSRRKR